MPKKVIISPEVRETKKQIMLFTKELEKKFRKMSVEEQDILISSTKRKSSSFGFFIERK